MSYKELSEKFENDEISVKEFCDGHDRIVEMQVLKISIGIVIAAVVIGLWVNW